MKIVHCADLHLGYRQYGMPERQDDYLVATAYIFKKAVELGADLINLGGDIFHSLHPPASSVYFLHSAVKQAIQAGIDVVGIDGNHDSTETAWLRVCNVVPLEQWDSAGKLILHTVKSSGITIAGLNGGRTANIRAALDKFVAGAAGQHVDILCMHLPLAEMAGFEGVEMSARDIADRVRPLGVRCVLLGDIHNYKETVIGGIRFIYSGSPEMTALDEQEHKSFSVIDITADDLQTSTVLTPTRAIVHKHLDNEAGLDTILADVKTATADPKRPPLVIVTYDPAVTGLRQKTEGLLLNKGLIRVVPLASGHTLDIFGQITERSDQYERKGAMRNLKEVIKAKFDEASDEFSLIVKCIEQPENVEPTMLQFAKTKGLDIK